MMSVTFLISQLPQNTGQLAFDLGEEEMKQESCTMGAIVVW